VVDMSIGDGSRSLTPDPQVPLGQQGNGAPLCCGPVSCGPLAEEDADALARVLAALADPVRLRIFSIIASADEVCSCNLEAPMGKSQPTISHHTSKLAAAGLITGEKRGRWTWWRVVPSQVEAVRSALSTSV